MFCLYFFESFKFHSPLQSSTTQPILLAEVWVTQLKNLEYGTASPSTNWPYGDMVRGAFPHASQCLKQMRDDTMVIREEESSILDTHQLQQSEEQVLHLARAAQ